MTILILICLILTGVCCWAGYRFLTQRKQGDHRRAIIWKGTASACFTAVGILFCLYRGGSTSPFIAAGLFCGLVGDELLAMRNIYPHRHDLYFCSGAVSFTAGHFFYLAALVKFMTKPFYTVLPAFGVLMILSVVYIALVKADAGKMKAASYLYVGVEALMCSAALCAAMQTPGIGTWMFFSAGLSFFVSDNLLIHYTFGPARTKALNISLHITYYLAQLLIAWSIFFL